MHIAIHYAICLVGMIAFCKLRNEGDILQNAKAAYKLLQNQYYAYCLGIMQNAQFRILPITYIYSRLRLIEPPRDQVVLTRLSGETDLPKIV